MSVLSSEPDKLAVALRLLIIEKAKQDGIHVEKHYINHIVEKLVVGASLPRETAIQFIEELLHELVRDICADVAKGQFGGH